MWYDLVMQKHTWRFRHECILIALMPTYWAQSSHKYDTFFSMETYGTKWTNEYDIKSTGLQYWGLLPHCRVHIQSIWEISCKEQTCKALKSFHIEIKSCTSTNHLGLPSLFLDKCYEANGFGHNLNFLPTLHWLRNIWEVGAKKKNSQIKHVYLIRHV